MALPSSAGAICKIPAGASLFDCADRLGIRLPTSCNRHGICHECIVEVRQGFSALAGRTPAESFLRDPYRLGCQALVRDPEADIEFAPLVRRPKILPRSTAAEIEIDPMVARHDGTVFYDGAPIDEDRGRI